MSIAESPRRAAAVSLIALAIRALVVLVIVQLAGGGAVRTALSQLRPGWIALTAAAALATFPAYGLAYRSLLRGDGPGAPGAWTVARIVLAGFGPLGISGGFAVDRRVLGALGADPSAAGVRVGAMATVEWAVLAPLTWVAAVTLLVTGAAVPGSLLWPWAVGVPIGLAVAAWAGVPGRAERLSRLGRRRATALGRALGPTRALPLVRAVAVTRGMARRPRRFAGAWAGIALYWSAELCALYAALHASGLSVSVAVTTIAYATGYLASRRSLPLGGAGLAEALLVYALYELHEPLGPAVVAVMVYRAFNFLLVVIPSWLAYRDLQRSAARGGGRSFRA